MNPVGSNNPYGAMTIDQHPTIANQPLATNASSNLSHDIEDIAANIYNAFKDKQLTKEDTKPLIIAILKAIRASKNLSTLSGADLIQTTMNLIRRIFDQLQANNLLDQEVRDLIELLISTELLNQSFGCCEKVQEKCILL